MPLEYITKPFVWSHEFAKKKGRIYGTYGWNPFRSVPYSISVSHPKILRELLQSDYVNYDRSLESSFGTECFWDLFGGLVFQPNGQQWKDARDTFEPFFRLKYLQTQAPMFEREVANLITSFEREEKRKEGTKEGFDAQELLYRMSFDTIINLLFGYDPHSQLSEGSAALTAYNTCFTLAIQRIIKASILPEWMCPKTDEYKVGCDSSCHLYWFQSHNTVLTRPSSKSSNAW